MIGARKRSIWPWLIFLIILCGVIVLAIIMNKDATKETAEKITSGINIDNGDQKINWDRYPTYDIELTESLEITEPGTYHLTGELNDGMVNLNIKNTVARLILDNVLIKNSSGPAIYCEEGEDLIIELVGNNYLEDGATYASNIDSNVDGVLYSNADLTMKGDGSLIINANYQDAIVGKDDLKINGGTYNIAAVDDGVRGNDSVYIVDGDLTISSGADAIKTENIEQVDKGFVLIENGDFNLTSTAKSIKASKSILTRGGNYVINSRDDAIHSDSYVGITNGTFDISSGDDGIHANSELIIDGGTISVSKAYEGLEAQVVTINDGQIKLTTNDDGINAGGGADESANNRPGANQFNADENCILSINGGDIYINSSGDGVDSNGYLYFNGGKVVVDGPTNDGNGALDAGVQISFNGGEVVAVGASGMAESLGEKSNQCNISVFFSTTNPAGTKITIKNSNDETVLEHTSTKSFNHLAAGTSKFIPGETYTIYLDDKEYQSFSISTVTTTIGNSKQNQNPNSKMLPHM